MADDKIDVLGGFAPIEALGNLIKGGGDQDSHIPFVDPEDITDEEIESTDIETEDDIEEIESVESIDETEGVEPETVVDPVIDPKEDPETEEMIAKLLQERLAESLNYEFDDGEKFSKVQDVVDYLENLVNEASSPQYANEEVGKLDEFVKNGGDLKKYFDTMYQRNFDIDEVDITDTSDQKRIIKEALKEQGVRDELISKRIERYENNDVLEEEALEAQEFLVENKAKKEKKLLETQREQATQVQKNQREFIGTVEQSINKLTEVRGIKVTKQEKKELLDYILRPTADGMTKYQKDYVSKDKYINNLIESAFFTKNGDALIKRAKEQATSDTYKNIQKKLQDRKDVRPSGSSGQRSDGNAPELSRLGSFLIGK